MIRVGDAMGLFSDERPVSESERWDALIEFVKGKFPKVAVVTRDSFPGQFSLREYEELMGWSKECSHCTNPERCRHYGYRGCIQLRRKWYGREYPEGIFIPEYYGGKCSKFLDAQKERKKKNSAKQAAPQPEEYSLGFEC